VERTLSAEEFLKKRDELPVIDVRSPAEFIKGHVKGSSNIPLFSNEERAIIGTIYKREGKDAAVLEGLRITGPKMADYVIQSRKAAPDGEILVYCWRGGMRSGSFSWLLNTAGLKSWTMTGGYKSYRSLAHDAFTEDYPFIVLGGTTGSGKTAVLHELKKNGEQIIDLENLANHRGSSFGELGLKGQPQTEHFENLLFEELRLLDKTKRIWIEDESKSIGRVYLPDPFLIRMKAAPVMRICVSDEVRIKNLLEIYGESDKNELITATDRLRKKLGGKETDDALLAINEGRISDAVKVILHYYDSTYTYTMRNRLHLMTEIKSESGNPAEIARELIRNHS
jgi:tRNA 2-selenouridine synthase